MEFHKQVYFWGCSAKFKEFSSAWGLGLGFIKVKGHYIRELAFRTRRGVWNEIERPSFEGLHLYGMHNTSVPDKILGF
jgi:hypothetical protein